MKIKNEVIFFFSMNIQQHFMISCIIYFMSLFHIQFYYKLNRVSKSELPNVSDKFSLSLKKNLQLFL